MADTTQQLAATIRAAIADGGVEQALAAHLADPVSVHHDPAMPTDGPMSREAFIKILTGNPMAAALPDGQRSYGTLGVDGDQISFDSTLSGASRTGEAMRIANRTVLTVAGGKIVKLVQRYEPSAMAALAKLFGQAAAH